MNSPTSVRRIRHWILLIWVAWWLTTPMRTVLAAKSADEQTPAQTILTGRLRTGLNVEMALGYHFTPLVDGTVSALGGRFNGLKTVRLFDDATGTLLASAIVPSPNTWSYTPITPVPVRAGSTYTVAVYLAGTGGVSSSLLGQRFPLTVGDIQIESATDISTKNHATARPTNKRTLRLTGEADIRFVPAHAVARGSVTINGGAAFTNTREVTLTFNAGTMPDASAITHMACSNNGISYSSPEPLVTTRTWTLTSGDGAKTVRVKFGDGQRWSAPVTAAITLDTKLPHVSITSPTDGTVITTLGGS